LKHESSLRPGKNNGGGAKIMHIFMKIRGKERLSYLRTYLSPSEKKISLSPLY